ncbi:MAG: hypothetical protein AB7F86_02630 [Bdellovibrionales bacterium]
MADIKTLLRSSLGLTRALIRQCWWILMVIFSLGFAMQLSLEDTATSTLPTDETARIMANLTLAVGDLLFGILIFFALSFAYWRLRPQKSPRFLQKPFDRPYLGSFFAEYLRVLGQILLWALLVLIPGFIRYVHLIFVPLIVLFSSDYEDGKIDALKQSQLMVKNWFWFLLIFLALTGAAQLGLELLPLAAEALHEIPARISLGLVGVLISVWSYSVIVLIFEQEMQKQ